MSESSKNNNSQNVKKNEVTLTFGMSRDFIDQVRENINNLDEEYLKKNVLTLHPADIADLFEILSGEQRRV